MKDVENITGKDLFQNLGLQKANKTSSRITMSCVFLVGFSLFIFSCLFYFMQVNHTEQIKLLTNSLNQYAEVISLSDVQRNQEEYIEVEQKGVDGGASLNMNYGDGTITTN